ncbi:hypothetical protein [Streptomyces muensis]|uniref:Uncharacterized protein n=1 Tax=Streptomyces muensis TaxID=1077944 RepID=A0A9X1TJ62_STRM4|nr:hypothetical protein [Streptomyces muensis]MCF1592962.1 hypothetical protein [Streptomyces muensis]
MDGFRTSFLIAAGAISLGLLLAFLLPSHRPATKHRPRGVDIDEEDTALRPAA